MTTETHYFRIAELNLAITFHQPHTENMGLIPSLEPFRTDAAPDVMFHLSVDANTTPVTADDCERIRVFDTGNGDTVVDRLCNGGYQYLVKDTNGSDCCLLRTDKHFKDCRCALFGRYDMRSFGLNNALMLVFAFAASHHETLLLHASLVRCAGRGYAFIAKSGTGKSTQVSNWLRYIPNCDLMNDDNPVVRIINGQAYIYGSPWSGKTPCYRNVKAPLGAITRIDRAPQNSIDHLSPTEAFASLLPSCSSMKWDADIFNSICTTIGHLIEIIPTYVLHCLPDKASATLCHNTISK